MVSIYSLLDKLQANPLQYDTVFFSVICVIDIRTWVRSFVDCLHSNLAVSHPFYKFSFCSDRIASGLAHLEVNNIGATKYFKFVNNDGPVPVPVPVPGPALLFRHCSHLNSNDRQAQIRVKRNCYKVSSFERASFSGNTYLYIVFSIIMYV